QGWRPLSRSVYTDRNPAVSLVGNGTYLFVMVRSGYDGYAYLTQGGLGGAFTGWVSTGIATNAGPGETSAGNRTVAFITDVYGRILYNWWDLGGGGHGWIEVPGGGRTADAVGSALVANGTYVFVIVRGLDNNLYLNQGGPVDGVFVGWQYAS